jgi:hypothetical protein
MRIQRRLEMVFVLTAQELGPFLIGTLGRLEMNFQVALQGYVVGTNKWLSDIKESECL